MGSIGLIDFLDLTIRFCIVTLAFLTSYLIIHLDADVVRSRIYVSFHKLKKYFVLLTFGFILNLFEVLISIGSSAGSTGDDGLKSILILIFQLTVVIFFYHLYVAIKVPDRRIL